MTSFRVENASKIRAYGPNVVVRLDDDSKGWESEGGILLGAANIEREYWLRGTVLSAGHGIALDNGERYPLGVKAGDRVMVPRHCAYLELSETGGDKPREVVIVHEDQLELAGDVERAA